MAAARTINNVQLTQLHLSMFQTWQLDNRVPSLEEITNEAKQNPQLYPLIKDEVIILTGTNRGDGVWAYSRFPQRMNDHYVVTAQGVSQMAPAELQKRLEQQGSPIKMDK
jgi:glycerophosphoryl diester phosphodiesterase